MQLKRLSATDEVFNILHDRICSKQYKEGEFLPSQDQLAKEIGVSRNTIREAVTRLVTIGILTTKQGAGTVIQSNEARPAILHTFKNIQESSPKDAVDVLTTRYTIERSIVRLAVLGMTKKQLSQLRDNLNKQKEAIDNNDIDKFTELDLRFHILIADASGSNILRSLELANLELYRNIIPKVLFNPLHMKLSYESHVGIGKAIVDKDSLAADKLIRDHILRIAERLPKNARLAIVKKAFTKP